MGVFNLLKHNDGESSDYSLFSNWLDRILSGKLPKGIKAFNFNLYEGSEGTYDIQLIGSDEFDEDDSDWACTYFFSAGEDLCFIKRTEKIEHWEEGLKYISKMVKQYVENGTNAHVLKNVDAVGIGFVDGE